MNNPFRPTDRMLRQFAVIWIVFFGGLALWRQLAHDQTVVPLVLGTLALTIGLLGLAWPRLIRPIFVGWMMIAYPVSLIISHIILGLLFYLVFTPLALLFRLVGRDALALRQHPSASTYWKPKPLVLDKSRYLRQF